MLNKRRQPNIIADNFRAVLNQEMNRDESPPKTILMIAGGLVFFSIVPYAGADAWTEAAILAIIFVLGALSIFRRKTATETEFKQMLLPISVLAFYSFAQGLLTLFVQNEIFGFSAALPYSYDLTASFWCALKFFAAAIFIKVLLVNFRGNVRFMVWSLIFTGNFFAVLGISRFLLQAEFPDTFGWFLLPELRAGIGFGTFINQNHFAFLMLMNLGLNSGLCASGGLKKSARLLLFIFSLLTWISIVLTASRGGIISSFIVIAVLIFSQLAGFASGKSNFANKDFRSKTFSLGKAILAIGGLAILLVCGIILIGQDRVVQRFEEIPEQFEPITDSTAFRRIDVWRASSAMIGEHQFYGIGFGGFRFAVAQYIDISGAVVPLEAHNDYLELAASGGAFSVICGVWFLYKLLRILKKRFDEQANDFENAARIGAICAFAGIAVHNFFDFGLQLIANWLFFAALLSIAVYSENAGKKAENNRSSARFLPENLKFPKTLFAIVLFCLSGFSLIFGYSRFENARAKNDLRQTFVQNNSPLIPFDADFYTTKAFISQNLGDLETAAKNLNRAIVYRPKDYVLWLNLGRIRQSQNQMQSAEIAFQKAIELAPRYGEPHFYYGKFLLINNRPTEGFKEMRFAFQRDQQYFGEVVTLAWSATGENAEETIRLLSPFDATEKEHLVNFLFEKQKYESLADLLCETDNTTEQQRTEWTTKLLEKRQFLYAFQVDKGVCDELNPDETSLRDGDFQNAELKEGIGFGWRVGNLPNTIEIGFDEKNSANKIKNLEIIFKGNSEPSLPLLSQTIIVEKNRQYKLSFAYRTDNITSGGIPVLQLIFKQPESDSMFKEIKFSENSGDWVKSDILIQTGNQTEALEIRLARKSCNQTLCPIFGRLWLDNFIFTEVKSP